jgi:hypothetical protein
MTPDLFSDLLQIELSDEAASQIADFLAEFSMRFEDAFFGKILRHHATLRPEPSYDPRQLDLFPDTTLPF